jgi:hypothetical protein
MARIPLRGGATVDSLTELARKFVDLSDQLEAVRVEIKRCVLNGGGDPMPNHPPRARAPTKAAGRKAKQSAKAEAAIVDLISETPMRTSQIARATSAKVNTVSERMKRLCQRGAVRRDEDGLWAAAAAP